MKLNNFYKTPLYNLLNLFGCNIYACMSKVKHKIEYKRLLRKLIKYKAIKKVNERYVYTTKGIWILFRHNRKPTPMFLK